MTLNSIVKCTHCDWHGLVSQCQKTKNEKYSDIFQYNCPKSGHALVFGGKEDPKFWFDLNIAQGNAQVFQY